MMSEMLSRLARKEKPKTSGTDIFQKEVRRQLGDKPSDVERDGGPSYLPATYNSAAANRERDGVPKTTKTNSVAANAERDGGGATKGYAKGGSVSSRADGIAQRGKTRGRMC